MDQAELLTIELEKNGHIVTYSPASHPLRLLRKNFDTIHLLTHRLPLKPKQYIFALAAQALGLSVILSLYDHTRFNRVACWQLQAIDGLTTFCLSQYNQLKFFNKNKIIFPGLLTEQKKSSAILEKPEHLVVFPILNSISELPDKINLIQTQFVVDASRVSSELKKTIKREWTTWKKNHPQNESALLSTQWDTIQQLTKDQSLVIVTSHLKLNALQTMDFTLKARNKRPFGFPTKIRHRHFHNCGINCRIAWS